MSTYFGISSETASSLFSSLNSASGSTSATYLSDYANIKNGSYHKLLKSYYAKEENSSTTEETKDSTATTKKQLALMKSDATELYEAANKLTDSSTKDEEKQLKEVKSFVEAYNNMLDSGAEADSKTVLRNTAAMTDITDVNSKLLAKVGVSVGADNKLTIDEDAFKDADDADIKALFRGGNSYAADILARTSNIYTSVVTDLNKSNSYNNSGSYSNVDTLGNLYNSLF